MKIVLDISANTHDNDIEKIKEMINIVKKLDPKKHEVIFKHQLFEQSKVNKVPDYDVFNKAKEYAAKKGYKTTASVFDNLSLEFLLSYDDLPFIKIANNRKLDYLIDEIPRGIPIVVSYGNIEEIKKSKLKGYQNITRLLCVSNYPATFDEYENAFGNIDKYIINNYGISDHIEGLAFLDYKPKILEMHYVLEHDENNPDGGKFAKTPDNLRRILNR